MPDGGDDVFAAAGLGENGSDMSADAELDMAAWCFWALRCACVLVCVLSGMGMSAC